MSEREYYTNSPYVNYCKWKGYEERTENEASVLRVLSYRIHQSLVKDPLKLTEYLPLPSDKKVSREQRFMTNEMRDKILKRWQIKKIKDV